MKKELKKIGYLIIGSAIIWGAVIVGCSFKLKETSCYEEIQYILFAGVLTHFMLIWFPLAGIAKKGKQSKEKEKE